MAIIKNFSQIKDMTAFLNSVASNPVATEIATTRASITTVQNNISSSSRDIASYESGLLDVKRRMMLYTTEKERLDKKLKILEKVAIKAMNTEALEKLDATKFDAFLRPMGLRFFSCHAVSGADAVYLYVVREAKPISYIVAPPLMLRIRYGFNRDYNTYTLTEARAMPLVHYHSQDYYVHPHINSSSDMFKSVCLGNYFDILTRNKVPSTFSNWQDHCLLLDQLLSTYNPDSPYIRIDELARSIKQYGYKINDRENTNNYIQIDSNCKFVILADGLEQRTQYNPENILTKGMFDRFEAQIHGLDSKQLVSDLLAELTTIYWSDDVESYDRMNTFYSSVNVQVKDFDEVSDWSEYDEDNDQHYLNEENFDSLKDKWLKSLRNALTETRSIEVPKMDRAVYASYFGEEETTEPVIESTTVEVSDVHN